MTEPTRSGSPQVLVRTAALFYVLVFATGSYSLVARGTPGMIAGIIAGASYVVVTVLFYLIFRPVSPGLSLLAAIVSLMGCAIGPLGQFHVIPFTISPLVFFGGYCLLIAYLIDQSTFLPRFLSVLMAFAGLGWLTFLSPTLAKSLQPYNFFPGIIGEGVLTLWLLIAGVNAERWIELNQAGGTPART